MSTLRSVTLAVLVIALFLSIALAQHQPSSSGVNPGCYDGSVISVVKAIDNECSALNNITGLQTFCAAQGSGTTEITNTANGITYIVSCPPGNGTDEDTGIYVVPGGTLTITAFTAFTPSQFANNSLNDYWCSGFRTRIESGNITGGTCVSPVDSATTCTNNNAGSPATGDFRSVVVGGGTADEYCSFAGGEGHPLLFPTFQSYSSPINYIYTNPNYTYPQGALVYRIGDNNPPGGSAYSTLYTGPGVSQGAKLSAGVNSYAGYSGGNSPVVNADSPAKALIRQFTVPPGESGKVFLCFWDYYNLDNYGNVHVQVTYHPPRNSPTCGILGDPQFVGLRGQSYQVHGIDGAVYNLITDRDIQVNARFVFLSSGVCPLKSDGSKAKNCWSHPGSYLGEISLQQRIGSDLHKIRLVAGPASTGFSAVMYDGQPLTVGGVNYITTDGKQVGKVAFSVSYIDSHTVQVVTPSFTLNFENSDMFINQELRVSTRTLSSHGLIGQTWSTKTYNNELKYIEGDVDDYLLPSGNLDGTDFPYNKF